MVVVSSINQDGSISKAKPYIFQLVDDLNKETLTRCICILNVRFFSGKPIRLTLCFYRLSYFLRLLVASCVFFCKLVKCHKSFTIRIEVVDQIVDLCVLEYAHLIYFLTELGC